MFLLEVNSNILFIFFFELLFLNLCCTFVSSAADQKEDEKESDVLFYRNGWPKETFDLAPGSNAILRCNHIGYIGNPKKAPPAFIRWFKDGKLIKSLPGKTTVFGEKRKPLIEGTKLNLTQLEADDAGVYTCKLALRDTISDPVYILSMNFTVNVKIEKTAENRSRTDFNTSYPGQSSVNQENSSKIAIIVSLVSLLLAVVIIISCSCLINKRRQHLTKQKLAMKKTVNEKPINKGICESSEICDKFLEIKKVSSMKRQIAKSEYVNSARYKDYFPSISDDDWEILEKSEIDRSRIKCRVEHAMPIVLGTGNFGQVYQGFLHSQDGTATSVAVKRLNDSCQIEEIGHFLSEAITMLKAGRHTNIISLIGSVLTDTLQDLGLKQETKKSPILLMEVAGGGNLKSFLQARKSLDEGADQYLNIPSSNGIIVGKELTLKDLSSFILQAAKGMQHLSSKKIVHRDLAARNVLITSNRVIKIADFGLSKHMRSLQQEYYRILEPSVTPAKWTAPEALRENIFSVKSDVWSFGVLMWEIYTLGRTPYFKLAVSRLYRHLAEGNRLGKPHLASDSVYLMMERCWRWDIHERPDFDDIVEFCDDNLVSVSEPYFELHGHEGGFVSIDSYECSTSSSNNHLKESPDIGLSTSLELVGQSYSDHFAGVNSSDGISALLEDRQMSSKDDYNHSIVSELSNPMYGFAIN